MPSIVKFNYRNRIVLDVGNYENPKIFRCKHTEHFPSRFTLLLKGIVISNCIWLMMKIRHRKYYYIAIEPTIYAATTMEA